MWALQFFTGKFFKHKGHTGLEGNKTTKLSVFSAWCTLCPHLHSPAVSYFISFSLYALVLKHIPMGIAYAIWGGLGGAGVVLIGVLFWHDKISALQVTGILLIISSSLAHLR